jgi:hypothetical protein
VSPNGLQARRVVVALDRQLRVTHAAAQGNARIASSSRSSAE